MGSPEDITTQASELGWQMLFILRLAFLVIGLWLVSSAKPPEGLLRLLFGKGNYELSPDHARLLGLLLASPLPISMLAKFILGGIFGSRFDDIAMAFESIYFLAVLILAIVISWRIRRQVKQQPQDTTTNMGNLQHTRSYVERFFIMAGLALTSLIALGSLFILAIALFLGSVGIGLTMSGDFSRDFLPFILLIGFGLCGSIMLLRLVKE